jgi:hypothetical protein
MTRVAFGDRHQWDTPSQLIARKNKLHQKAKKADRPINQLCFVGAARRHFDRTEYIANHSSYIFTYVCFWKVEIFARSLERIGYHALIDRVRT